MGLKINKAQRQTKTMTPESNPVTRSWVYPTWHLPMRQENPTITTRFGCGYFTN